VSWREADREGEEGGGGRDRMRNGERQTAN